MAEITVKITAKTKEGEKGFLVVREASIEYHGLSSFKVVGRTTPTMQPGWL